MLETGLVAEDKIAKTGEISAITVYILGGETNINEIMMK